MVIKYFQIFGKPIAKKRPRFVRRGNFIKAFNDQETEEGRAYLAIKEQWLRSEPLTCPVRVGMYFYFPVPASKSRKIIGAMLTGDIKHQSKPDIDNAAKFYLDVMNSLIFLDDKQVYSLTLEKGYSGIPITRIMVEWEGE